MQKNCKRKSKGQRKRWNREGERERGGRESERGGREGMR